MPISATGNPAHRVAAGFTLVELMVVMVIVGLASAAVMLAMPGNDAAARSEAQGLAARLVAARDLAIIGGRDIRVTVDSAGYRLAERHPDGWRAPDGRALAPHRWPAEVTVTTEIADGDALRFDATGLATPGKIRIDSAGRSVGVTIDSVGAVVIDAP